MQTVDLWPSGYTEGDVVKAADTSSPSQGDDILRLNRVTWPQLAVMPSDEPPERRPAVIVCPGGGYEILAYDLEGTEITRWLTSIGVAAFLLKYRVPRNRDGALQDIRRAVRLVRQNSAEWGVDPDRVGVLGFSAGGHLCARLSSNPQAASSYPHLDAADSISDRPDFSVLVYPAYLSANGQVASELPLGPTTPPTLIVHAEDDHAFIEGARIYAAAATQAGAPCELKTYPSGGHGHGLRSKAAVSAWLADCEAWFRKIGVMPVGR